MSRLLHWLVRLALLAAVLGALAYGALIWYPLREPHPVERATTGVIAIEHATVLVDPDSAPLLDATLVARDGRIVALGANVAVPADARRIACDGCVVTAGFWNAHVHLTEPTWNNAAWASAARLQRGLDDLASSHGFTTIVDLGSDLRSTISLRRRIAHGELRGPRILTAGAGLYPPDGIPYYLADLPAAVRALMPQPATPDAARADVRTNIERGADVVKLFTGSLVAHDRILPMPVAVATAAVDEGHAHRQLVFTHPSNGAGIRVALDAGVDILAHAPSATHDVDSTLLVSAIAKHVAMIPTLQMFAVTVTHDPSFLQPIVDVVHGWHVMGGALMFGTDVGYMRVHETSEEFLLLARAGIGWRDVLRMLTVTPAARLGFPDEGRVRVGAPADLVLLTADPAVDPTAFARVRAVVRRGALVWEQPQ